MFLWPNRRRSKEGEKGQGLVEFTLLVPIFLLLVFAIVDFGMGFHAWITVTNSAREGARLGAVGASADEIEARVRATAGLPDEDENMTITVSGAEGAPGGSVVVQVDYQYSLITPLAGIMEFLSGDTIGPDLDLSSTAEMRLE